MKTKTSKLRKLEESRYSIVYDNLDIRCMCELKPRTDLNEVFCGRNRQNSMKYGCVMPLCRDCHTRYTNDRNIQLHYMKLFQEKFEESHSRQEFIDIFKRNYL